MERAKAIPILLGIHGPQTTRGKASNLPTTMSGAGSVMEKDTLHEIAKYVLFKKSMCSRKLPPSQL
jgi:hypothetical protein